MIQIEGLTKRFSNGKGLCNINVQVQSGEVFGYLGPNGAGKSTTIRHLMGYIKPDSGFAKINRMDCWKESADIQKIVGYLPGEIAFFDGMNGEEFLLLLAGMRELKDIKKMHNLIDRFQFDVKTPIRKMSKGMKQKVGIVAAFMHNPDVLILDEPTSGLDPLMQRMFVDLLLEEKKLGKTILLSSHIFHEIEKTCDRVAIIKDGVIMTQENIHKIQSSKRQIFEVILTNVDDVDRLKRSGLKVVSSTGNKLQIEIQGNYNELLSKLASFNVQYLSMHDLDLEEVFMDFYDRKEMVVQ